LSVNFANQSESLASIKELDVVPEKLDSLSEQQQTSTDESREKFNQSTKILTEYGLNSNQENEKSQHVSHYYSTEGDPNLSVYRVRTVPKRFPRETVLVDREAYRTFLTVFRDFCLKARTLP
jgi:hypothetical protein